MVDFSKMSERIAEKKRWREGRAPCAVYTGSRDWQEVEPVRLSLQRLREAGCDRVVHGLARGLDRIVDAEAAPLFGAAGIGRHAARWSEEGRAAGINRNYHMVREEEPHVGLAWPLGQSIGTWHCAVLMSSGCPVLVYLGGIRNEIARFALDCEVSFSDERQRAVCIYIEDRVRQQVARAGGVLSWPQVSMPDRSKAWAQLTREEHTDPRGQRCVEALLR
jgi:hypothetical protein